MKKFQACTGFEPLTSAIPVQRSSPFRLSFRNCKSCVYNCDNLFYISFFILQFLYMIFIYSLFCLILHGFITNRLNDQIPVSLLAQLVRALHRYHGGQVFESHTSLNFFSRFLFASCKLQVAKSRRCLCLFLKKDKRFFSCACAYLRPVPTRFQCHAVMFVHTYCSIETRLKALRVNNLMPAFFIHR